MLLPWVSSFGTATIIAIANCHWLILDETIRQTTRDEGPKWHEVKTGTTQTMGCACFPE